MLEELRESVATTIAANKRRQVEKRIRIWFYRDELTDAIELIARAVKTGLCTAKTLDNFGIESADLVDTLARSQDQLCRIIDIMDETVKQVEGCC